VQTADAEHPGRADCLVVRRGVQVLGCFQARSDEAPFGRARVDYLAECFRAPLVEVPLQADCCPELQVAVLLVHVPEDCSPEHRDANRSRALQAVRCYSQVLQAAALRRQDAVRCYSRALRDEAGPLPDEQHSQARQDAAHRLELLLDCFPAVQAARHSLAHCRHRLSSLALRAARVVLLYAVRREQFLRAAESGAKTLLLMAPDG